MEKLEEDLCYSCKNKSNIREVLYQLHLVAENLKTVAENLKTIMSRLVQIEHIQRISCTTMNGIARIQKRNFDKMIGAERYDMD